MYTLSINNYLMRFRDVQNNQGGGRVISWRLRLITLTETLIILDIIRNESDNRWLSLTWLLYNLQLDFGNALYAFGQSEKRYWLQCIIIRKMCWKTIANLHDFYSLFLWIFLSGGLGCTSRPENNIFITLKEKIYLLVIHFFRLFSCYTSWIRTSSDHARYERVCFYLICNDLLFNFLLWS